MERTRVEPAPAEFTPLSEPPSAVPSAPPSSVEPGLLESEGLGAPSSPSSANVEAGRVDPEPPSKDDSRARTAQVEPIGSSLEPAPAASNPRTAILIALCVIAIAIAIAIAIGWFMTR